MRGGRYRGVAWVSYIAIGSLSGACSTASYVPKRPESQVTKFGQVTPTQIQSRSPGDTELRLETELIDGARLHGVYHEHSSVPRSWTDERSLHNTTPAGRTRCSRHVVSRVALDGVTDYHGVSRDVSGQRRITLPIWLITRRGRPDGWPRRAAAFALGVEVPIGVWHDTGAGETTWFGGIGLTTAWPMF